MLKKVIIIIILFVVGGWGISYYFPSDTGAKTYKVFSNFKSLKFTDEVRSIDPVDIIDATNKERVAVGLSPLSVNTKLNISAQLKVDDMISKQYFEHESPSGEGVSNLGTKAGYQYVVMGENLALGNFNNSEEVVLAWMNSPGHKANILNKKYQDIGVSIKHANYEGKEVWFAVQHFGTSRNVCPNINKGLKSTIDTINRELKEEERVINALKKSLEMPGAQNQISYQNNVSSFNLKVEEYNTKLALSREKINSYNKQVKDFNACISKFQ